MYGKVVEYVTGKSGYSDEVEHEIMDMLKKRAYMEELCTRAAHKLISEGAFKTKGLKVVNRYVGLRKLIRDLEVRK